MIDDRSPPIPDNEEQRCQRVAALCYRDEVNDEVLDRIVVLAAEMFNAPICLISILEQQQQWFRAKVGIDISSTPRDVSFCGYTILGDGLFEVPDTHLDAKFRHNILVTGHPNIRYYAGVPLVTADGYALGSLCVIDTQPRPRMSTSHIICLGQLAQLVVHRLNDIRTTSFIDKATRLMNRVRLEEDIHLLVSGGHDALLIVVDFLSPMLLNDIVKALGYAFPLELVREISLRLVAILGKESVLYRVGVARFAFIKPKETCLASLFWELSRSFLSPVVHDSIPIQTKMSMGALVLDKGSTDARDWVRLAVSAADHARYSGTGWAMYESEMDVAQQRAFTLLSSLSYALERPGELSLVYQPRICFDSGKCSAVEALLRWTHPVLGPIGPAEFVPLAEKTELIRQLSIWVAEAAVKQIAEWRSCGYEFRIAINVSPSDLEGPSFTDNLLRMLRCYEVEASALEVEFTEGALIRKPVEVRTQLTRLRALGIEIAIDDFGTGYSNWTYLRDLPATSVKLDRSLIKDIHNNEKDRRLVMTLIDLAQRLGYRVVAEGIESAESFRAVQISGCDEAQGFFIAKPMPPNEFIAWLGRNDG